MGLSTFEKTYIQVEPVPGSDWVAVAHVSQDEVLRDLHQLTGSMLTVAALTVVIMLLLVLFQVRYIISRPVAELSQVATRIAQGELEQSIQYRSRDELGVLADNFNQVTLRLRDYVKYINEISEKLREIAGGNLAFTLENEYDGEFEKIKTSLDEISYALNDTIGQLHKASSEVAAGAEQVSGGAMELSQGSTEQAAEVDALANHIGSVSDSVQKIAQEAQKASQISQQVKGGLLDSSGKMQNMTQVIQRISEKSAEINNIVKTIEDIAFQTNILALNAAVEAARAGTAGKGFAVVADEVRNLAAKSAEASQSTSALIGRSIAAVNQGTQIAGATARQLEGIVANANGIVETINAIAADAQTQAGAVEQIQDQIGQITGVVQTNSSTAEESAATSQELSAQASVLKQLVKTFRLRRI